MPDVARYPSLNGRTVMITGGASGIGAAMVKAFAVQRARVSFIDVDECAANRLVNDLKSEAGARVSFVKTDVSNIDQLRRSLNGFAEREGCFDILVNNAADDNRHAIADVTPDSWMSCISVNLNSVFFAIQSAASHMIRQRAGAIINMSSINALLGPPNMPGYVTAKAAIIGLTKASARELGPYNVRVNAVLPGWVATERQLKTWLTHQAESEWETQTALNGRILAEDVADLVLFLAADESRRITGQNFVIDAGRV